MSTRVIAQRQRQMERAYEVRNLSGFEGDAIMRDKFKQIIKDYNIDLVVELGAYLCGTTRQLSSMVDKVIAVEINAAHFSRGARHIVGCDNVMLLLDDSLRALPDIIRKNGDKNMLIFIDSHWQDHNPLLEELDIIASYSIKPVIVIHDFKVPGTDLGYDTYKEIVYEWDWIKEHIERIYGIDGYVKEYNSQATGAKRGVLYIYPNAG